MQVKKVFKHLLICLLLVSIKTQVLGQAVENVKAIQQGSKVLVTYDLRDQTTNPYDVKLLMSRDGGVTFGDELKSITGDVKNIQPGIAKLITWNASEEISYYEGEAVFRVVATLNVATLPEPVVKRCAKIELTSVTKEGRNVVVDFVVTAQSDCTSGIDRRKEYTSIFDAAGNQYQPASGRLGDAQLDIDKKILKDVPIQSQLIFENVPEDLTTLSVLKIGIYSFGGCNAGYSDPEKVFNFSNVTLSR